MSQSQYRHITILRLISQGRDIVAGMSGRKRDGAPASGPEALVRAPLFIREVPGDTPRERLAWLLDFAYLDLRDVDEATHSKLWSLLTGLVRDVTKGRWQVPFSEKPEREAFRLLKSGRRARVSREARL